MANVKTLLEFYNSNNALTARAAEATAANQTNANIESARIGQDAKRLEQEKQLEFFRQKMEDLRSKRATTSAKRMNMQNIDARSQAATLSQTFEGSQNAANKAFNLQLQEMQDANAQARTNQEIQANLSLEDRRDANTMAREMYKEEQGVDQATADLEYKRAQTADIGRPKPQTREDLIKQLNEAEKLPSEWYGGDKAKFKDRIVKGIKDDLAKLGENPDMIPEVLAAKAPTVAAKAKALASNLDTDFEQYAQDGRIQRATQLISDYQAKFMQGIAISAEQKRRYDTYLNRKLKALKITQSDIAKLKQTYSLE